MIPRRILFIAEGQLGDLLLLTPALRAVRTSFPSTHISLLLVERRGSSASSAILTGPMQPDDDSPVGRSGSVDSVLVLRRHLLRSRHGVARLRAEWEVVRAVRGGGFDTVVCTFPEDRFALYALASGASIRVGQREQGLSWLLSVRPETRKEQRGVREYYCDLVRAIGARVASVETMYAVPTEARRWAAGTLARAGVRTTDRLVLIHPGATGDYKIWPPDRFAALADRMGRLKGVRLVLAHGPMDRRVVDAICGAAQRRIPVIDSGGKLSHLAALMERSRLCITNDSGPRHLAVAVGVPSLALFRQHHDREWKVYEESPRCVTLAGGERCSSCPDGICNDRIPPGELFGSECLRQVSLDAVVTRAAAMLGRSRNPHPSR